MKQVEAIRMFATTLENLYDMLAIKEAIGE
jgi:hypothetical protein